MLYWGWLYYAKPQLDSNMLTTEIMNECFLMLLFYHNVLFSGVTIPGETEYVYKLLGSSLILTIIMMVAANLIIIGV